LKELNSPGKKSTGKLKRITHTPIWSRMFRSDGFFLFPAVSTILFY